MNLIPRNYLLDTMFDDFLTSHETSRFKCDIYEKDNKYYIEMDAPGFTKDDLTIETDDGYLTVRVEKSEEHNDDTKNYIKRERNTTSYQRSFYIGEVDSEQITASFKDGSVTIVVPKSAKIETKKTIAIE